MTELELKKLQRIQWLQKTLFKGFTIIFLISVAIINIVWFIIKCILILLFFVVLAKIIQGDL